jgi:hypothetical protein
VSGPKTTCQRSAGDAGGTNRTSSAALARQAVGHERALVADMGLAERGRGARTRTRATSSTRAAAAQLATIAT